MDEQPKIGWRAWLAGALFLGVLAAALLIGQRSGRPVVGKQTASVAAPTPSPAPILPRPAPPLDRAGLIRAAETAASALATGSPAGTNEGALVGRRFELRLPFGCEGPAAEGSDARFGWRYDAENGTLRAFATPQDWTKAPWLGEVLGGVALDKAEGFAIERPWILEDACPAGTTPTTDSPSKVTATPTPTSPPQKPVAHAPALREPDRVAPDGAPELGLVQLFDKDAPRSSARGDRGYTTVVKRAPDAVTPNLSFVLALSGRIATFPSGQPIACWGEPRAARPHCLFAAQVDHVAILDNHGEQLAEWQP